MRIDSSQQYKQLLEAARGAMSKAVDKLNDFAVGSALLCKDGTVITGANMGFSTITNICAERCAVATAHAAGRHEFTAVAVSAAKKKNCWPCGVCRQHLFELGCDLDVIVENEGGALVVEKLSALLPQFRP